MITEAARYGQLSAGGSGRNGSVAAATTAAPLATKSIHKCIAAGFDDRVPRRMQQRPDQHGSHHEPRQHASLVRPCGLFAAEFRYALVLETAQAFLEILRRQQP